MPISLTCPDCGGKLRVADNLAGKKIKCPKCAVVFPVPPPDEDTVALEESPAKSAEGIATATKSERELDELEEAPRGSRNIRRDSGGDAVSTLIPYKNGRALAAYYCGVFSLIPGLGLLLGPIAALLGLLGLLYVRKHPTAKGTGHAIAGIVFFIVTLLEHAGIAGYIYYLWKTPGG